MRKLPLDMLWHIDNPKQPLSEAVLEASAYYESKYLRKPTFCHVPLKAEAPDMIGTIRIKRSKLVIKNHLYLGVEE